MVGLYFFFQIFLRIGLYHSLVSDALSAFPSHQVNIVRHEDYAVNRLLVLDDLFSFLQLSK